MQPHPRQSFPPNSTGRNDAQMSSSNSTATSFLGGRQKSWMQNTCVAPPVSPSSSFRSRPYPTPPTSAIDTSPGAPYPSSSSSSAFPPSPAQSYDAPMPTEGQVPAVTASLPAPAPAPAPGVSAPTAQHSHVFPSSGLPCDVHTTPVTEANFTAGGHHESSETVNGGLSMLQPQSFVHQNASGTFDSSPAFVACTDNQSIHGHTRASNDAAGPYPTDFHHQDNGVLPPRPLQEPTASTVAANAPLNMENKHHHPHSSRGPPMPPNKPAPVFSALSASLESLKPGLPPTACIRVQLLQQACAREDIEFLSLHQVYSLSSFSPDSLRILQNGFGAAHNHGLKIVENLLSPNAALPPAFVSRCSRFPAPIEIISQQNPGYLRALNYAVRTLEVLSTRWPNFETVIGARNFPPLIDELISQFWVQSSIILKVMFTAFCRRLRGNQVDEWCVRYEEIFQANHSMYMARWKEAGCAYPEGRDRTRVENEYILRQYSDVLLQQYNKGQTMERPPGVVASSILPQQSQRHGAPVGRQQYPPVQPVPSQPAAPPNNQRTFVPAPSNGVVPTRQPRPASSVAPTHRNAPQPQQQVPAPPNTYSGPSNGSSAGTAGTHIFPRPGYVPPEQRVPNPLLSSLHEAHLMNSTRTLDQSGKQEAPSRRLYQCQCGFAMPPQCLGDHASTFQWTVDISPATFQALRKVLPSSEDQSPVYGVVDGSKISQLRCVRVSTAAEDIPEAKWFEMDSVWPEAIYIHVNGKEHFVRRKVHNGKDLPTDITGSLKEGQNQIKVTYLRGPAEFTKVFYAVAVEMLETAEHDRLRGLIRPLPYSNALLLIQQRLEKSAANDDELSIVDDHITIDLIDPFMARIFNIPVRATACSHWECFDLDTYLSTRLARTVNGNGMAETWKCPICGKDARPTRLFIDGFLAHVRIELQKQNKVDTTRAILVKRNGTWEPKVEGKTQRDGKSNTPSRSKAESSTVPNPTFANAGAQSSSTATQNAPEVIELD